MEKITKKSELKQKLCDYLVGGAHNISGPQKVFRHEFIKTIKSLKSLKSVKTQVKKCPCGKKPRNDL